jgi:beta-galactosidase/beta-glucuronidase
MSNENPIPQFPSNSRVDLEVIGTTVTNVVRFGDEFIVMFNGGSGRFYSPLTDKMVDFPIIIDMTFTFTVPDETDEAAAALTLLMEAGVPSVLLGMPNEPYILVGQNGTELSIPRSSTWN